MLLNRKRKGTARLAEYIDREAVIKSIQEHFPYRASVDFFDGQNDCIKQIKDFPIADVAEVKHGSWIVTDSDSGMCESYAGFIEFHCSECGLSVGIENGQYDWYYGDPIPWKFCPICGAKMDGKENAE